MHADKTWQVADWLESYAHSLELDVWTSSTVTRASQDPETKKWTVEIERANAEPRTFVVNHLVFAIGFAGGTYKTPQIPGAVRDDVMTDKIKHHLTFSVRKISKEKFFTLSIIRRPKITREKR
jgi:cation diffusion facilitator CzcD-associated flavoprotein CzcO